MRQAILLSAALASLFLVTSPLAQTNFPEVEPNGVKAQATPANGMVAGDTISGTTTGTSATVGSTLVTTADVFRVKTGPLALGVYRHTLTITAGGPTTYTSYIRGLNQVNGVIGTTDIVFQTGSALQNTWYGFGRQEEINYQIQGTAATTAAYTSTLTTTAVTPIVVAGAFVSGLITVTTAGQGHASDTELYLYDSNFDPVPLGHHDGVVGSAAASTVTVPLAAGTYYIADGLFNTSNNQSDLAPTEGWDDDNLLEYPNAVASNSTTNAANVAFSVSDGTTTTAVPATKNSNFEIVWATFTVVPNSGPPVNDDCANAVTLGATAGGDLTNATNDGAASCDPGGAGSRDVWFSYTDPTGSGGTLSLDTCGTGSVDTVLSVHSACGGSEIACNDDCGGAPCGASKSCLTANVLPNQTVKIRVSDKGQTTGFYVLHSSFVGNPPTNDSCATPIVIGPGTYGFDNTLATTGAEGQGTTVACQTTTSVKKDLWYTYTATTNGSVTFSTCGLITSANDDTKISYYAGAGCPTNPSPIGCDDDACVTPTLNTILTFNVTCGEVFTIQLGNFSSTATVNIAGSFSVTETGTSCATATTSFCLGDGTGAPCPCLPVPNNGGPGRGCGSQMFPNGALLTSTGIASDETGIGTSDTLVLTAVDVPGPALFIQSNGLISPIAFGDGHLCAFTGLIRLGVVFPGPPASPANVASYPGGLTPNEIHIQGLASAGQTKHYQAWYRSVPGVCTSGQNYDLTQGLSLVWVP